MSTNNNDLDIDYYLNETNSNFVSKINLKYEENEGICFFNKKRKELHICVFNNINGSVYIDLAILLNNLYDIININEKYIILLPNKETNFNKGIKIFDYEKKLSTLNSNNFILL